jgi:release factor glutamine methyltransferase
MIARANFKGCILSPAYEHPAFTTRESALVEIGRTLRTSGYQFTTPTPATHERVVSRPSFARARDLRGIFGWNLPFSEDLLPEPLSGLMRKAEILTTLDNGDLKARVRFSTLDDCLFVHSAYPTVQSDAVFFGPDTSRFVAAIADYLQRRATPLKRVADIGCGAGPGGIAVARRHPDATVDLLDINAAALSASRVNAAINDVGNVAAIESDVMNAADGAFDLIVSNPPYLIDAKARAYRHGGGDFGEGLSLRILREAISRLAPGGSVLLYTGSAVVDGRDVFGAAARRIVAEHGLDAAYREIDPDVFGEELETPSYARADRIAAVLLTASRS